MEIINKTRNTTIATKVCLADTFFKRVKGLIGRKEFFQNEALIIRPCNSVHTFFMSFPIDLLFVDSNNRVVKAISDMQPFRISALYFKAILTVELPAGTIVNTATRSGDILQIA